MAFWRLSSSPLAWIWCFRGFPSELQECLIIALEGLGGERLECVGQLLARLFQER